MNVDDRLSPRAGRDPIREIPPRCESLRPQAEAPPKYDHNPKIRLGPGL